jgi:hypothetical protein
LVPWSYWSSRLCLLAWQCASDRPQSGNRSRDYVGCNWPSVGSTLVGGANPLTTPSWAETGPAVPDRRVTALADKWTGRNPARTLPTSYSSLRQFTKLEPGVRVREFSAPDKARFVHTVACPDARTGRCRRRESRPTGGLSFRGQLGKSKQQDAQPQVGGDHGPQPPLVGRRQ